MAVLKRWLDLVKRDHGRDDDDWPHRSWYWNDQARAIKWGIFFGILTFFFVLMMAMYYHADRRMKNGQPPLRYHRWLVPRTRRAQFEPNLQRPEENFSFYHQQQPQENDTYGMHAVPPPAYNPNYPEPPVYSGGPPIGATKVDPAEHPAHHLGEGSSSGPAPPPPVAVPASTPQQRPH
ncbi:unnamed protein product [Tuber melanosporum]|uniref:(Perigord truffle) hypothetical protein n=1 Tax=Tuber melanosporum (strain Mel28) TaxID=656061 RepID=D5GJ53_TUBMM|nr:uncharacterized protein GSTUM_00008842001 [Tuber melanosporum]CAZ84546.1 unnamed protein product [Tuber melanosporum]